MAMYNEITMNAFSNVPEEILEHESVQNAIEYVDSWVEEFENNWIDPSSEYYAMELLDAQREGAVAVAERYRLMLEEALYRQDLFGSQFDLRAFVDNLSTITLDEVLEDAR
jgi:hypothetical protein